MGKECKGKAAARALAVMVRDPRISAWLAENDPKALQQAQLALRPFGWPDPEALAASLSHERAAPAERPAPRPRRQPQGWAVYVRDFRNSPAPGQGTASVGYLLSNGRLGPLESARLWPTEQAAREHMAEAGLSWAERITHGQITARPTEVW